MSDIYFLPLLFIGMTAGVLAGMFGVGGGIVIVPMLVMFMKYPQHMANGTSLVALLAPVGILGVYAYYQAGKIGPENLKAGMLVALGLFIGTFFGSKLAIHLPADLMRKGFAIFMVLVAVKMWFF